MIKAIVFDVFGVLHPDTFWTLADVYLKDDLDEHREELHDLISRVDLGHITRDDLWQKFAGIVDQTKDKIYQDLEELGGLDKRLLAFIEDNKDKYKFGIISNVGVGFLERMFTDKPAEHYFDSLVLSSEEGLVKPDIRIYQLSAKQLGVDTDECVFTDDRERFVEGAETAGMKALHYTGYSKFMKDIGELLKVGDTDE